jgi:hypothetical protein
MKRPEFKPQYHQQKKKKTRRCSVDKSLSHEELWKRRKVTKSLTVPSPEASLKSTASTAMDRIKERVIKGSQ